MSKTKTEEELLYFNGIDGATGNYELPPMTAEDLAAVALGETISPELYNELKNRRDSQEAHYGINADTTSLAETGWGVIFAAKDKQTEAIREALKPLLDLRREQATKKNAAYYKEFMGGEGYRPDDTHLDFLGREPRMMGPGSVNPEKVPYYLLLVGDPEAIPYRFQYQLDVQYAVGRIHFETLEEYAQYAQSVVEAETGGKVKLPRQAVFFGAQSAHDQATTLSAQQLITPLSAEMATAQSDWTLKTVLGADAKKAALGQYLGGKETPALLFTASHGMGFPNGNPRQLAHQGALLCSDWPGPREWQKPIPENFYFSADDVSGDASLLGMMAFFFACYGAGTPKLDEFANKALQERQVIAPYAFMARLPQKLLSHPKGGALAVVGHVERAWGYSFMWRDTGRQLQVFKDALDQLMAGQPIGAAMEWFNERHAELSVVIANEIEEINEYGKKRDDAKIAGLWTANKDARSYVIIGDPAVRLPVIKKDEAPKKRPTVTLAEKTKSKLDKLAESGAAKAPTAKPEPAAAPQPTAQAMGASADYAVEFGLKEQFNDLATSLRQFTDQLAQALSKAASDISTLEVTTYAAEDLEALAKGEESATTVRAMTRIAFDGDTQVYVPAHKQGVDQDLWQIHMAMVQEAQANRAQFLQTMAEMATNLLKSLKP